MIALITNIAFAVLWLMLSQQPSFTSFILGYLVGFGLIALFSNVFGGKRYVRRTLGFARFLIRFSGQFIKANLDVARLVLLVPSSKFNSGFVEYSIDDMTFGEALLLSHCITLTPGTITALFDWKRKLLRIHVLDFSDRFVIQKEVDQKLKQAIWKFSR